MMQIEQYGLQWTIDVLDSKHVTLKQSDGLTFLGKLSIHPVWGPYIVVNHISAFVVTNNTYKKREYELAQTQWFFVPELEDMCDSKRVRWYHILHETHEKNMFKLNSDNWYVLMTDLLREKQISFDDVFDLFYPITSSQISFATFLNTGEVALFIENDTYKQLPRIWTIDDIYKLDKDFQDTIKEQHEQLWYSISQAKQADQSIIIPICEENTMVIGTRYICTEQKTPYGMILPVIIPYQEQEERGQ